ncbi:uncharacterized protein LOC105428672 [Pogonomyrmex barbatus]|uniref:Uncharacterized protein LOC105428672 n=1 Tax=Pogonomyrmex barbatus TaxID=144034 RepID=A0A6I9WBD2_9HYME|nr:uncharacterized protein LOC105428672 [Pogonomyrmex barbatus]
MHRKPAVFRRMRLFIITAALLHIGLCDHVAVKMPYLNPAGVTYVNDFDTQKTSFVYTSADTPLQTVATHLRYAASAPSTKIETHHVGYAAAQVPTVAAVPFIKYVPTISQVPVTTIEAQPGILQKQVDVIKPAVTTRKIEVRRPAIQKQFYDIEERVIIRPVGSAVVELDEPTSKTQKGPAVIQPLTQNLPLSYPQIHDIYAHAGAITDAPVASAAIPVIAHAPVHVTVAPVISHASTIHATPSPLLPPSSTPLPTTSDSNNLENESVVIENPDFRGTANQARSPQLRTSHPRVVAESNEISMDTPIVQFTAHDPSPAVIPSQKISPENSKINQNRLIELLTARGGVVELNFNRDDVPGTSITNVGHVRARVLSATSIPEHTEPTGERVSTRRIVVSRPIETFQEYDIVEPATKIERISIQQPTLIKTAHVDHMQVHGSIPIVEKTLTPAVAHTAIPVYQKIISSTF